MYLKRSVIQLILSRRLKAIDEFRQNPHQVQRRVFDDLVRQGERTKFGREFGVKEGCSPEEFARLVRVCDYDSFKSYIERMIDGESDVASPGRVKMFARSSGTTSERSKYIPVSESSFFNNHMRGMSDVSVLYHEMFPDTKVLDGKVLTLGGSSEMEGENLVGDLSGLLIKRFSIGSRWFRLPRVETAMLTDFDEKCERICRECVDENITSFAGVPSWNLALMSRILEYTGKSSLVEVWENLELFAHGGIEMTPYRHAFEHIAGGINYQETYNASEGFFAIADDLERDDMLLMLDYETYFEFRSGDDIIPLEGVRVGVPYAVLITSSNGLWRYEIGDVVEFTSVDPYRIRFAGRTRQFINAFGEEVIADNSDKAIVAACERYGAVVSDYMVAPRFMELNRKGCHEWLIEFVKAPRDIEAFVDELDAQLREINSDYDAKRCSTLDMPVVRVLRSGTFLAWMRSNKKNKVPRLSNDRTIIDPIIEWIDNYYENQNR